ncbi:glycosyltransferase family 2 protein, partial [Candidatus Saccharibacteria bacterium]|nr:glycosyltransferase family 2 protein [Candidatus Saccharibacteria bacterium]
IGRCLKSLTHQTYSNIEIIVVNDASTDRTLARAQAFAKDSRVKIINHRKNTGAYIARSDGVSRAKGEYCLFVDSDDWIEPSTVKKLVTYFNADKKLDMIRFNFCSEKGAKRKSPYHINGANIKCFNRPEQIKLLAGLNNYLNSVANCAYKTAIVRDCISGPQKLSYAEDFLLNIRIIKQHKNLQLGFINDELYHYCYRQDSTTKSKSQSSIIKNLQDQSTMLLELEDLCAKQRDVAIYHSAVIKILYATRSLLFCLLMCEDITKQEFLNAAKTYTSEPVLKKIRSQVPAPLLRKIIRQQSILFRLKYRRDIRCIYEQNLSPLWRRVWFYRIRRFLKNA